MKYRRWLSLIVTAIVVVAATAYLPLQTAAEVMTGQ